jgi:hypothetical protein
MRERRAKRAVNEGAPPDERAVSGASREPGGVGVHLGPEVEQLRLDVVDRVVDVAGGGPHRSAVGAGVGEAPGDADRAHRVEVVGVPQ